MFVSLSHSVYRFLSLFFLSLCSTGKHTIFGRVCAGIAVVKQIGMVEIDSADR